MTGREGSLLLEGALVLQSEDWGSSCVEVGRLLPLGLIFLIRNMGLPLSWVVVGGQVPTPVRDLSSGSLVQRSCRVEPVAG